MAATAIPWFLIESANELFSVADFYDRINGSAYEPYAQFLTNAFEKATIKVGEVLDLGCGEDCGTGSRGKTRRTKERYGLYRSFYW